VKSPSELITHLGVAGIPNFFGQELCRRLRADVRAGSLEPARVRVGESATQVNENYRRSQKTQIATPAAGTVEHCLRQLQSWCALYYGIGLSGFEPPQYLLYRQGDFFSRHADGPEPSEFRFRQSPRKVSVVVFLNGEKDSGSEDSFCGGELVVYGGGDSPDQGWPIVPSEGLLVAFPSFLVHEVKPVTSGERISLVSWFS